MSKISIVIPLYNEQDTISELYKRLKNALHTDFNNFSHEVIFVDDGSCDTTFAHIEKLHVSDKSIKAIQFSRNFGHHIAISAGLDFATGDFIVMMDGDLQDQPEEIKKLYQALNNGYDVAAGKRIGKKFSLFRRVCSSMFVLIIKNFTNKNIIINNTIFRIMTKQVADEIRKLKESNRYIVGLIGWVGFKHTYVPVIHGERYAGSSKYNLRKQFQLAANAIFSFSDYPLRFISRLGFILVIVSVGAAALIIIRNLIYSAPVVGWASLMTTLLFLSGMQIFLLGILGEYIGRSYVEIKNRPLYIIRQILEINKGSNG